MKDRALHDGCVKCACAAAELPACTAVAAASSSVYRARHRAAAKSGRHAHSLSYAQAWSRGAARARVHDRADAKTTHSTRRSARNVWALAVLYDAGDDFAAALLAKGTATTRRGSCSRRLSTAMCRGSTTSFPIGTTRWPFDGADGGLRSHLSSASSESFYCAAATVNRERGRFRAPCWRRSARRRRLEDRPELDEPGCAARRPRGSAGAVQLPHSASIMAAARVSARARAWLMKLAARRPRPRDGRTWAAGSWASCPPGECLGRAGPHFSRKICARLSECRGIFP